jgi:hypothetical protein
MRAMRFPIRGLMGLILVVALGMAALRNVSATWAGVMFLLTCGVLSLAAVGVVCRHDDERAWWLGFSLFGWGYLQLSMWTTVGLPTMNLLDVIAAWLGLQVRFSGGMGGSSGGGFCVPPVYLLQEIAHCLWAIAAALVGGLVARGLFGGSTTPASSVGTPTQTANQTRQAPWLWPAVVESTGVLLIFILVLASSRTSPGFLVGTMFLLTCALLGMTILGAIGEQGKVRQIWLGAAIFGISYMVMAFGRSIDRETWPSLPTDHFLEALRPWFPPVVSGLPTSSDGVAAANARIWEALQRPVPMPFPEDTPIEDVLKHVQTNTRGTDGKGIPIYVNPIGMQEAEKTPASCIRNIDFDGVPLKISLRLCLDQLDLMYGIRDGVLVITSKQSEDIPIYQDPFLIVGHCVLALLAAGFGGVVAPVFSARPTARAAP